MGAGLKTSVANAGQVSLGYAAPWAAPGIPLKAMKWLLSKHSPLVFDPRMDWPMLRFMLMMPRKCTRHLYELNKVRMLRLGEYSRRAFGELRAKTGIHYDERLIVAGTAETTGFELRLPPQRRGRLVHARVLCTRDNSDNAQFEMIAGQSCCEWAERPGPRAAVQHDQMPGCCRVPARTSRRADL